MSTTNDLSELAGLGSSRAVADDGQPNLCKVTVADKWIVSGYIQAAGKGAGAFRAGICQVGKNPKFNNVDPDMALAVLADVKATASGKTVVLAEVPIVQALKARKAMLESADAKRQAVAKFNAKNGVASTQPEFKAKQADVDDDAALLAELGAEQAASQPTASNVATASKAAIAARLNQAA